VTSQERSLDVCHLAAQHTIGRTQAAKRQEAPGQPRAKKSPGISARGFGSRDVRLFARDELFIRD
jgi:hypothetical protein